ncbi:uncharacterized protein LOC121402972 [Xenopus laevis]|uniref:Uncharacterized protein LOC121402972 n=1 Tax=Xenopus laevis TaxID=8355 RepID=A0A8J1MY66_XENLA|nr:uncharacterized protein LOC121402972 [Xenopus laevis]
MVESIDLPIENLIMVTMDVQSLYTCIPHTMGIEAVRKLITQNPTYKGPCIEYTLELLEFVFQKNYFKFETNFYIQRTGNAMGSKVAPVYANAFMSAYEDQYIYGHELFKKYGSFYRRYIDDLFFIWSGPIDTLEGYINSLNTLNTAVRLTLNYSLQQINFLDVEIYKYKGRLQTRIYTKATDRNTLLHYSSHHPRHLVNSLPKSQMIRVVRIDSDPEQCLKDLKKMGDKFLERGYPKQLITDTINTVQALERKQLLQNKPQKTRRDNNNDLYYISKYNPQSKDTKEIILKYWEVVARDDSLSSKIPKRPRFSYARNTNLKEHLSPSDPVKKYMLPKAQHFLTPCPGVYRCTGCVICNTLILGKEFRHPRTGKRYVIKQRLTCTSTGVIYIIKCPCGLVYCGKTT